MKKTLLTATLVGTVAAFQSFGAGFAIYEVSARGNAVGGTLVGSTKDASANYFNPANLTETESGDFMISATFISPSVKTASSDTPSEKSRLDDQIFTVPSFFITQKIAEPVWLGFGVYSEFGLGTSWDEDRLMRTVGPGNNVFADMLTVTMNPNIAVKITDELSIAAGLRIMYFQMEMRQHIHNPMLVPLGLGNVGYLNMKGDAWGVGYGLAATYRPLDNLSFGLVYKSKVKQDLSGIAHLQDYNNFHAHPMIAGTAPDLYANAEASVVLPPSVTFGANWDATESLTFGATVTWTGWSSYRSLGIYTPDAQGTFWDGMNAGMPHPKDWRNVFRYSLGVEYALSEQWTLMGSYVLDRDPINRHYLDTLLPAGNRSIFSAGLGWSDGEWSAAGSVGLILMQHTGGHLENGVHANFTDGYAPMLALSIGKTF